MATYTDNLFSASTCPGNAITMLQLVEARLLELWGLRIKPGSREYMVAEGCDPEITLPDGWSQTRCFAALGHVLQPDGGTEESWRRTKAAMWRSFFANAGSQRARRLPLPSRLALVNRAVLPSLDYRCSRWPVTRRRMNEIRAVQHKMVAIIMRIPMDPGELPGDYVRRRARRASEQCRQLGQWSLRYADRVVSWHDHLHRPLNARSWAAQLYNFRGHAWLVAQRLAAGSVSVFAGRTGTRVAPGHVRTRWHDGVELAKEQLAHARRVPVSSRG